MVHGGLIGLVFKFSGNPLGTITATFGSEDSLDPGAKNSVVEQAFLTCGSGAFPFVIRGPVEFQHVT